MTGRAAGLRTLMWVEAVKARGHRAFWALLAAFAALVAAQCWGMITLGREGGPGAPLMLPDAWRRFIYVARVAAVYFVPVTVTLLTAGEFRLHTARQHVAAGLSRGRFFTAKVLVTVGVAGLFWALSLAIGLAAGLLAGRGGPAGALVRPQDLALMGAYLAALLGYGALGTLAAFVLRSPGAAAVSVVGYAVAVDGLLGAYLSTSDRYVSMARHLPTRVFDALMNPARYDAATFAAVQARFAAANVPFPEIASTPTLYATALAYVALCGAAAYATFAHRDL